MERNSATVGQIKGLLEAWGSYGTEHCLSEAVQKCNRPKQLRLIELFNTLDTRFVVRELLMGLPSTKELLEGLAHWL